jgi:7-cyano-7-deazaguanine synthase
MEKSLVLLSGGLDSCVALAIASEETTVVGTLSFSYGQRHHRETVAAHAIGMHYGVPPLFVNLNVIGEVLAYFKGSALVDTTEALPSNRRMSAMTAKIPRTYVPGRNTIMLAVAQSIAEARDIDLLYTGFNAVDFSGYPDCRPIFVEAWNNLAKYSTKRGHELHPILVRAPLINWSKVHIVQEGMDRHAPLNLTWSCYRGEEKQCGTCDSCIIRADAFSQLNLPDPSLEVQSAEIRNDSV